MQQRSCTGRRWSRTSVLIFRIPSCSCWLFRRLSMESTSSTNMTQGVSLWATANSALTYFSASPNHLLAMLDTLTLMKLAPAGQQHGVISAQATRLQAHAAIVHHGTAALICRVQPQASVRTKPHCQQQTTATLGIIHSSTYQP